jgi:hypothetical protein
MQAVNIFRINSQHVHLFQVSREVEGPRVAGDGRRGEDDAQARQRGQGRTGEVHNTPLIVI